MDYPTNDCPSEVRLGATYSNETIHIDNRPFRVVLEEEEELAALLRQLAKVSLDSPAAKSAAKKASLRRRRCLSRSLRYSELDSMAIREFSGLIRST